MRGFSRPCRGASGRINKLIAKAHEPVEAVDAARVRITEALKHADRKLARFKAAIADPDGGELRTLREGIRDIEAERERLQLELTDLDAYPAIREAEKSLHLDALKQRDHWVGLLGKHVGHSRQLLRSKREGSDCWYKFGRYRALLGRWPSLWAT